MSEAAGVPGWVYKRDGRLVPFEADKISQALFAASETAGAADAFLARELTDGILHFLEKECGGTIPSTAQLAELIVKVVRELGQPALARAFAEGNRRRLRSNKVAAPVEPTLAGASGSAPLVGVGGTDWQSVLPRFHFSPDDPPEVVTRQCLRAYSLQATFSRDIASAHQEGLLTILGLEAARELAGCTFDLTGQGWEKSAWIHSRRSGALVQALLDARRRAGSFLAIDGPEYALTAFASAGDLAKNSGELAAGLEATGLAAVINLNCSRPPNWADEQTTGPLFADTRRTSPPAHVAEYRSVLLEQLLRPSFAGRVRLDWHLSERDFPGENAPADPRLLRLVRSAVDSASVSFTFDRASYPVPLAEGLTRRHPAVLLTVGLNLPHLLELPRQSESRSRGADSERFLLKLASLARMAVSAAVQKRSYLRRLPSAQDLSRGFLLDRARLVVVPIGLEAAVRALTGESVTADGGAAAAQQIVASLHANLRQAGHAASLDVAVDGPCWSASARASGFSAADETGLPEPVKVAGVTCWAPSAEPKLQLKSSGLLHAGAEAGTAAVLLPHDRTPAPEELVSLLHYAWQRTQIVRLRFIRVPHEQQQLAW